MSQEDSRRQPITSSLWRWYFSPTAKLGQAQTSLASPGVENHPSLHTFWDIHKQTQAYELMRGDTYVPKNSFPSVTGGEMGQCALWWMAFTQVMCSVQRDTEPHQKYATVPSSCWSINLLSATPATFKPSMLKSNISHSQQFQQQRLLDKLVTPGISWFEMQPFVNFVKLLASEMATCHHRSASSTLRHHIVLSSNGYSALPPP